MPRAKARDGVYTRSDRPGFWGSWIDASGRRRRRKLNAKTLQAARLLLGAEKQRAEKLKTLGYAEPAPDLFGAVLDRFLKHQMPLITPESYERCRGIIENQLRPCFARLPIGLIRRSDVSTFVSKRANEVSAGTVVKELNLIKRVFSVAIKEWELCEHNPASAVTAPTVPAGRVRYLGPGELRELIAECPDWLRPIVVLAAFTGMRRSEILGLRWMHVDLQGGRLMLAQTKNGEGRIVHLNGYARQAVLSQWSENVRATDRVFRLADDCTADNISKGLVSAADRAGIADFHFHDLRHQAATMLRLQGADIHTVAQVLGHKDLRMAMRYQHLSPEYLGTAMNRLDTVFAEPKKLTARSEGGEGQQPEEERRSEIVTAASPGKRGAEEEGMQLIDLIGSAIGDRTRTLRLERAAC